MIRVAPFRFHTATWVFTTALALGGCRAHYLGSYEAPDGGDSGAAGAAAGSAGTGGAGVGTGGAGASGAGVGGAAGSMPDASSEDAEASAPADDAADREAEGSADAPGEAASADAPDAGATCTGVTLPDPVAKYTFDDCDDARGSLRDTSPRNLALDATKKNGGVRCSAGHSGLAVFFNGDDDPGSGYLDVPGPNLPAFSDALTLSVWLSVWDTRYVNLLGRWYGDDSFLLLSNGSEFVFTVATPDHEGGVGLDYHVSAPVALYRWVHVVVVFDGASQAIYVDGKLAEKAPVDPASPLQPTTRALQMGGLEGIGSFFKGLMDEVRLYDVALDAAQVRALDCEP
jgi:hypothetical protein